MAGTTARFKSHCLQARCSPFGRLANNDIAFNRLKYVSGTHCTFGVRFSEDGSAKIILQDSSSNGTFVNGHKIGKGKKVILGDGDFPRSAASSSSLVQGEKTRRD